MHLILWEFTVPEENVSRFVSAYGSNGDWAKLFQRAQGFLGTQLLRSNSEMNTFLTVDRWESAACFENFQQRFGMEYKTLDAELEGCASTEKKIGAFLEL